jgi:cytochrome c-type biogenesis protein CcmE
MSATRTEDTRTEDRTPPRTLRSRRTRAIVLGVVALAGVLVLAASGFQDTLTYYRTPTEVAQDQPPHDQRFRVGGMVVPGSVERQGGEVSFVLTDGATDLDVVSSSTPPQTFREGQGAVVEGLLTGQGVFHADRVLVRHSNEYRAPEGVR